jgi:transcriptional regulator of arginine metabolism
VVDNQGKTQYRLPNATLIIVHTTPGAAGMVARILDQHKVDLNVLGTIAGDDTIFIAPKDNAIIVEIIRKMTQLFQL